MEGRAGNQNVLSHSTAHRIVIARSVPTVQGPLFGFLRACEEAEHRYHQWAKALDKCHASPNGLTPSDLLSFPADQSAASEA
jgi:hypothetical protein